MNGNETEQNKTDKKNEKALKFITNNMNFNIIEKN